MPAVPYVSQVLLKIDGQDAPAALLDDIVQVVVEESLHLPSMFTLTIKNTSQPGRSQDAMWQHESKFAIGKSIKIGFVESSTAAQEYHQAEQGYVIDGEITAIETQFSSDAQAPIIIRGYDISHRLHRGRHSQSFQNMTDSDIISRVAQSAGLTLGTIDSTAIAHDYVFQENQTHMQFLRERAARNGFELYVQDGKLNCRKPRSDSTLTLKWLLDLNSFRVRVSSADQVSSVEVRGWDYQRKEAIVATKNSPTALTSIAAGDRNAASTSFNTQPKLIVVDQPVNSTAEAEKIAQALVDELGGELVHADAKAEGNPAIRPGRVAKLADMGKYSGDYYITETRHVFQERVYQTEFSVRGLRGNDLLSMLSATTPLQPGQTLMIAKVTNNKDPKKWGRVRVKFPTLTEAHESNWARVISLGAGTNRGFDCLPEVNDEVLVGFEHGDIHRPFVIGGVWNGTDAPPTSVDDSVADGKVRLRTFKTRVGHELQFVEEDKGSSNKGVQIKSSTGHLLHFDDKDKQVTLKTNSGNEVCLDEQNKQIGIKTPGSNSLKFEDQTKKITMSSAGDLNISAMQNISLKVGGSEIKISNSGISIKMGGNKIEIAAAGITVQATGMVNVKGISTTVKGDATVTVSAPVINLN